MSDQRVQNKNMSQTKCAADADCQPGFRCLGHSSRPLIGACATFGAVAAAAFGASFRFKRVQWVAAASVAVAAVLLVLVLTLRTSVCQNTGCVGSLVYDAVCKRCAKRCAAGEYLDCEANACKKLRADADCLPKWDQVTGAPLGPIQAARSDGRGCTPEVSQATLAASCAASPSLRPKKTFDTFMDGHCAANCGPLAAAAQAGLPKDCALLDVYTDARGTCSARISPDTLRRACELDADGCPSGTALKGGACVPGAQDPQTPGGCRSAGAERRLHGGFVCGPAAGVAQSLAISQPSPAYVWPDGTKPRVTMAAAVRGRAAQLMVVLFPDDAVSNDVLTWRTTQPLAYDGADTTTLSVSFEALPVDPARIRIGVFGFDAAGALVATGEARIPMTWVDIGPSTAPNTDALVGSLSGELAAAAWRRVWHRTSVGRAAYAKLVGGASPSSSPPECPFEPLLAGSDRSAVVVFPGLLGDKAAGERDANKMAVVLACPAREGYKAALWTFDGRTKPVSVGLGDGDWGVDGGALWCVATEFAGRTQTYLFGAHGGRDWASSDQRSPLQVATVAVPAASAEVCARATPLGWAAGPLLVSALMPNNATRWCVPPGDAAAAQQYRCIMSEGGAHSVLEPPSDLAAAVHVAAGAGCVAARRNDELTLANQGPEPKGRDETQTWRAFDFRAAIDYGTEQCLRGVPVTVAARCGAVALPDGVRVANVPLLRTDDGGTARADDVEAALEAARAFAKEHGLPPPPPAGPLSSCPQSTADWAALQSIAAARGGTVQDGVARFDWLPRTDASGDLAKRCCTYDPATWKDLPPPKWSADGGCKCPETDGALTNAAHCAWVHARGMSLGDNVQKPATLAAGSTKRQLALSGWQRTFEPYKLDSDGADYSGLQCVYDMRNETAAPACAPKPTDGSCAVAAGNVFQYDARRGGYGPRKGECAATAPAVSVTRAGLNGLPWVDAPPDDLFSCAAALEKTCASSAECNPLTGQWECRGCEGAPSLLPADCKPRCNESKQAWECTACPPAPPPCDAATYPACSGATDYEWQCLPCRAADRGAVDCGPDAPVCRTPGLWKCPFECGADLATKTIGSAAGGKAAWGPVRPRTIVFSALEASVFGILLNTDDETKWIGGLVSMGKRTAALRLSEGEFISAVKVCTDDQSSWIRWVKLETNKGQTLQTSAVEPDMHYRILTTVLTNVRVVSISGRHDESKLTGLSFEYCQT